MTSTDMLRCIRAQHQAFVKDVLSTWDEGRSGNLTFAEVSKWLSAVSNGKVPTDDEVKWVICMANRKQTTDFENVAIEPNAFQRALEAWMSYNECKSEIETVFDKFDSDKSGGLDREQLRNLLTELNGGEAPNSQEVDFVLMHADVIGNGVVTKPELAKAVSVWYVHVEKMQAEAVKSNGMCGSGVCGVQ
mmetsp:Transcript_55268/g.129341  ORF Transcript_55268/g.129341 Transcript_55268/m.129341 type:complete len:190 (+) Transcript_55268:196-765(+)